MTEDLRDRFRVNAALDCQRRECVSEVMEPDMFFDACLIQQLFVNPSDAIRTIHPACLGRWEHPRIAGMLFVLCD